MRIMQRFKRPGFMLLGATGLLAVGMVFLLTRVLSQTPLAQAQVSAPTIGDIQANPSLYYDRIVTINGVVNSYVDANEFLLDDGTGRILVDPGPPWYVTINAPTGASVTVTGQIDRMRDGQPDLDACRIVAPGATTEIRDCSFRGPPPWAGGPDRDDGPDDDDDRDDAPDYDDDFYGIITARPAGTAGTWVIGRRNFIASSSTRLDTDDGPLTVGRCVSVDFKGDRALEIESETASDCAAT